MNEKPPYLLGLLCLIPLIGAFVGLFLLLYGIFKYKDKLLTIMGAAGIGITIFAYSFLFYNLRYGKTTSAAFARISQMQINSLVKHIEFYKMQYGTYPDSLEQVSKDDETVMIQDPLLLRRMDPSADLNFRYKKGKDTYILFSVGEDGVPGTADDIYPSLKKTWGDKSL